MSATFSGRQLRARVFLPVRAGLPRRVPILIYFHGGAFCIGSAMAAHETEYLANVADQTTVLIFSVDYQLYPDVRIPEPYDEARAFLEWVASSNGSDPWISRFGDLGRMFIGGDSAGGNIAHHMALRVGRDPLPGPARLVGAFLAMPYMLGSTPVAKEEINKQDPTYRIWAHVCPKCEAGVDDPFINPFGPGAPSLRGLGIDHMMIYVAENDPLFLDRQRAFYNAIKNSGWSGQVQKIEVPEKGHTFHVFPWYSPEDAATQKLIEDLAKFLNA